VIDPERYEVSEGGCFDLPFLADLKDGFVASRMHALNLELSDPRHTSRLYVDLLSCEISLHLIRRFCQYLRRAVVYLQGDFAK
jgi:hypothetical protein